MSISKTRGHAPDVVGTWGEAGNGDLPPLIVVEGLEPYVPGSGPISVERLGAGHSNETFRITRDGHHMVLRRPPRPPIPPTAHDVLRESRIMLALAERGARVPRPLVVHPDDDAIGAPFYLMEMVPGAVIRDRMPTALDDEEGRRAAVFEFVDALIEVHAVKWKGTKLEEIGRPGGYLARQLRRWNEQWLHNQTRPVPEIEAIGRWLADNAPAFEETTVVHGDAKLDNAIFREARPVHLEALVDWELATLGDPLADLGLLCGTYVEPGEEADPVFGFSPATALPGAPRREEIVARYSERTGRDITNVAWYEVLALWKIMILLEGSYKRYQAGTTHDPFFSRVEAGIPRMAAIVSRRTRDGAGHG
jgi:aminoglycoside phosphotransferase (APT) family kinase protein